jgi:hypothetical protein
VHHCPSRCASTGTTGHRPSFGVWICRYKGTPAYWQAAVVG